MCGSGRGRNRTTSRFRSTARSACSALLRREDRGAAAADLGSTSASSGLPIKVHPFDEQTLWTVSMNGDKEGRYPRDAAAAARRSRVAGAFLAAGLPQESCYFTVLRQGLSGDRRDLAGVDFGINTGSVFAGCDEGDAWEDIARHLPTILAVEIFEAMRAG
jgi:hypothetical protein